MKKYYKTLLIALLGVATVGATGCKKDDPKDGKITLAPTSLTFEAAAGTQTVDVTGQNWIVSSTDGWITATKSGNKLTVAVTENTEAEQRTGSVTVKNNEDTQTLAVTQNAAGDELDTGLEIDPGELTFVAAGETKTVNVTSELDWEATIPDDVDWLEVTLSDDSFTVTASINLVTSERIATITVDNGEAQKTIAVTQEAGSDAIVIMKAAIGVLWGDYYEVGVSNYSLDFYSTELDDEGTPVASGEMVSLDLFSDDPIAGQSIKIASGTYVINEDYEAFTALPGMYDPDEGSYYPSLVGIYSDEGSFDALIPITSGSFEVTENDGVYTVIINIELEDGEPFQAYWSGEIEIIDNRPPPMSNLTGDIEIPTMTKGGYIDYYGEYYASGTGNYTTEVWSTGITLGDDGFEGTGDTVLFEIIASENNPTAIPNGTYIVNASEGPGTIVAGQLVYGMFPVLSWYNHIEDGVPTLSAPLSSGQVTISNTAGVYTFDIDAYDDIGNHITGKYQGIMDFYDNVSASAPKNPIPLKACAKAPKTGETSYAKTGKALGSVK